MAPQPPTWALSVADAIRYFNLRPWQPRLSLDGRTEPLAQRVQRLRASWAASRLSDAKRAVALNQSILEAAFHQSECKRLPNEIILDALLELGVELALQNDNVLDFPAIDLSRSLTAMEADYVTARLIELQTRLEHDDHIHDLFSHGLCAVYVTLLDDLLPTPAFAQGTTPFTVPLYALTDVADFVSRLMGMFLHDLVPDADDVGGLAFANTRLQLWRNLLDVSRLTFEQAELAPHKIITPTKCELEPSQLVAAYLAHTPLAAFAVTPLPFVIPKKTLTEHGAIFAPSGHGKTQLLQTLIHGFLQEDNPPGMFIIDSQGDMLRKIERLDIFHPDDGRLRDRILIYDPEDPEPPALNFFKLGKANAGYDAQLNELFQYLFTAIDSELTTKQGTAVTYLLRLMAAIDGATIDTLRQVMEQQTRSVDQSPFAGQIRTLDRTTQDFFANQFYGGSMKETRVQVARRLYTLLADPLFLRMFSAPENRFNAFDAMQQRKIVLINTSQRKLGADSSSVFGRFFIAQCLAGAYQRADIDEDERHLALLIVDEASEYFDQKTELILRQARKFGLGLLFATQNLETIDASVKAAMNGNTSMKIAGPVAFSDANALAREMYTTADFIRSMQKHDGQKVTEFACYVRGFTPRAVRLSVPFGALEATPEMSEAAHTILRQNNRLRCAAAPPPPSLMNADAPLPTARPPSGKDDDDWTSGTR